MARETALRPGWLANEIKKVGALDRAQKKIVRAAEIARRNGYTQPTQIEFTTAELHELSSSISIHLRRHS